MHCRSESGASIPDSDMAGPILIALMLGAAMLLRGKVHFGYIYGVGVVGCMSIWLIMTLMSDRGIDVYQVICCGAGQKCGDAGISPIV